jgi:hypothetical protein
MSLVVFVNGPFGVGKTTVARLVAARAPGVAIFDPERIGYVLRRLPRGFPGSTRHLDDYQDSTLWRRLTVRFAALRARRARVLLLPMNFARADHLAEIRAGLERAGVRTREVCLVASDATLRARLASRGLHPDSPEGRWVYPRALASAQAHRAGGLGHLIPTDGLDASEVADALARHLERIAWGS